MIERFRHNGMEPSRPTAMMLLGAIHSDTVILNSPTTTERDHAAVDYLGRVLALDAVEFGREMFESTSDVSHVPAEEIVSRDAKEYDVEGGQICIGQIETVGDTLLERKDELMEAMEAVIERRGYRVFALMITDIVSKGTELLVAGDAASLERAFDEELDDGVISLPGVMSRKKQVAPKVMSLGDVHLTRPQPQAHQREDHGRQDRCPHQRRGGRRPHVPLVDGDRGDGHHQRQLRGGEEGQRPPLAPAELPCGRAAAPARRAPRGRARGTAAARAGVWGPR